MDRRKKKVRNRMTKTKLIVWTELSWCNLWIGQHNMDEGMSKRVRTKDEKQ